MSKINWSEARELYVYDERMSYQTLAKKYGLAKSSVQRHATKNNWQEDRWAFHKELRKQLGSTNMKMKVEAEERQLKFIQKGLQLMTIGLNSLVRAQNKNGELSNKELIRMRKIFTVSYRMIMLERTILGLPNRHTIFHNDEESYEYRKANGTLTDEEQADELDDIMMNAKKMQEYLERLEKYRNNG